jgi:predicted RNase H-like HicB family nuclease
MMRITVSYACIDNFWVASSPEIPELVAGDASLVDATRLAHEAIKHFLGTEDVTIIDEIEESAGIP